ncbi:hypothetical protein GCM10027589_03230 [Actinocorallia lasiicapitis]
MNLFKKSSSAIAEIETEEDATVIEPVEGQLSLDDLDGTPTTSDEEVEDQLALDVDLPEDETVADEPEKTPAKAPAAKKKISTAKPAAAKPAAAKPATDKPATDKPATDKPATDKPAGGPPLWVMITLGLVAAALLGGAFFLRAETDGKYSEKELDSASRAAVNAAQDISSWDYRTIESDTKNVLKETTGDFRAAYEKSAAKLLAQAPEQEAVVLGTASKAGVESADENGVRVLVFLNQSTNRKGAEPSTDLHRLRLTMVESGGSWLVSKLEVL